MECCFASEALGPWNLVESQASSCNFPSPGLQQCVYILDYGGGNSHCPQRFMRGLLEVQEVVQEMVSRCFKDVLDHRANLHDLCILIAGSAHRVHG